MVSAVCCLLSQVGSICDINNARVAAEMGVDVVLVCLGGLGSSFDELALNKAMLEVSDRTPRLSAGCTHRRSVMSQVAPL